MKGKARVNASSLLLLTVLTRKAPLSPMIRWCLLIIPFSFPVEGLRDLMPVLPKSRIAVSRQLRESSLWKLAITTVPVYGGIECAKGGGQKNLTTDEYRRAITLDPPTARPDSVVLIVLNTRALGRPYGHIHSDGSDLRLSAPDGKASLRFWIEHWDPHGDSRIWVRVPQQGTDRLWLCYGKAQA